MLGAAWLGDGTVVFGTPGGVMKVPADGGTPEPVTRPATAGEVHLVLSALPDGAFLYSRSGAPGARAVYVGSPGVQPEQQDTTPLLKTDLGAFFAPSAPGADEGHLWFMRDTTLVAQRFDAARRQLVGEAVPVAAGVYSVSGPTLGLPYVSVSAEGAVVYRTGTFADLARQLVWYGLNGRPLEAVGERSRYLQLRLSPDGSRLAASQSDLRSGKADVWIVDLATGNKTRLTFAAGANAQPTWSPDGQSIAWANVLDGAAAVYRKPANGAGGDELLYQFPDKRTGNVILSDWSRDGFLVIAQGGDIFALPVGPGSDNQRRPIPVVQTPAREFGPDLSPDSRWLAYISDETGRQELFVQPFAPDAQRAGGTASAGKWLVSTNGTLGLARWRADARELRFVDGDGRLRSVDVTPGAVFNGSAPRELFALPRPFLAQTGNPGTLADVSPDGARVLLAMPSEEATRPELTVIMNWAQLQGQRSP
jgi:hypothetical protein